MVPHLQDLMSDDLRRSCYNNNRIKVHNKCNTWIILKPSPRPPLLMHGKIVFTKPVPCAQKVGDCCFIAQRIKFSRPPWQLQCLGVKYLLNCWKKMLVAAVDVNRILDLRLLSPLCAVCVCKCLCALGKLLFFFIVYLQIGRTVFWATGLVTYSSGNFLNLMQYHGLISKSSCLGLQKTSSGINLPNSAICLEVVIWLPCVSVSSSVKWA